MGLHIQDYISKRYWWFTYKVKLTLENFFQEMLHTTKQPHTVQINGGFLLEEPSMVIMIQTCMEGSRVCGLGTMTKKSCPGGRWTLETPMWSLVSTSHIEIRNKVSRTSDANEWHITKKTFTVLWWVRLWGMPLPGCTVRVSSAQCIQDEMLF